MPKKPMITCAECRWCWMEGGKPFHLAHCSLAKKVTHRLRRGKWVEIPPEWRGKVTFDQTKNKRMPVSRRTRSGA